MEIIRPHSRSKLNVKFDLFEDVHGVSRLMNIFGDYPVVIQYARIVFVFLISLKLKYVKINLKYYIIFNTIHIKI